MGSKENIVATGLKADGNTEEVAVNTDGEESEVNTTANDGAKPVHISSHPRRESSIKSKSVLKQGHLRVKEDGQKVYKKTPSQAIMSATQLGIGFSVGRMSSTQERDVLMVDFYFVEKVWFPSAGTKETPSHKHSDFRFKSYAPVAFRYFRDLFGIHPSDFMLSLSSEPIREISNPGASGSLFFVSNDDMFIVKTVQHKEATFLQQLLPGYYMNIHQNQRTLLPKFFGLYCYQSGTSNIRLTVMNNLLPSKYKCHHKFDLKGSTFKRKANKSERSKKSPTWKDLDFVQLFPNGISLDAETHDTFMKTISRDIRVLESFNIMDYSFLLGIHNIDEAEREREANRMNSPSQEGIMKSNPDREARKNEIGAALDPIQVTDDDDEFRPLGGVPARNDKGERLILFMGIIDILQSYRLAKKMEHGWKSLLTDGDTVSVHKPSFYSSRFLNFLKEQVFVRCAVQRANTKRRSVRQAGGTSTMSTATSGGEIPSKVEYSAVGSDDVNKGVAKPEKEKVVTIVEPEPSLNGSIDYLSETGEESAPSEDYTTNDDLSLSSIPTGGADQPNKDELSTVLGKAADQLSEFSNPTGDVQITTASGFQLVTTTTVVETEPSMHNTDPSNLLLTKEELDNCSRDTEELTVNEEVNANKEVNVNEEVNVNVTTVIGASIVEPADVDRVHFTQDAIDLNDIHLTTNNEIGAGSHESDASPHGSEASSNEIEASCHGSEASSSALNKTYSVSARNTIAVNLSEETVNSENYIEENRGVEIIKENGGLGHVAVRKHSSTPLVEDSHL